jgi:hypothetical protein
MDEKVCLTEFKKIASMSQVPVIIFSTSSSNKEIMAKNSWGR